MSDDHHKTIMAVIRLLKKAGIPAGFSVLYESGKQTLVIVLPGVDVKEFIEVTKDKEEVQG